MTKPVTAVAVMQPAERINLEQIEAKYSGYPLDFLPGTDAGYSPLAGFGLLAGIVEKTTGLSYGGYIKENILDPLGMKNRTDLGGSGSPVSRRIEELVLGCFA